MPLYTHVGLCIPMVCLCTLVYTCVAIACVYLCMPMYTHVCLSMPVYAGVCFCAPYMPLYTCVYLCMPVYGCVYIPVYTQYMGMHT